MSPYDANASCPKCGHGDIGTIFVARLVVGCMRLDCLYGPGGTSDEHMHRDCRRCSYEWPEAMPTLSGEGAAIVGGAPPLAHDDLEALARMGRRLNAVLAFAVELYEWVATTGVPEPWEPRAYAATAAGKQGARVVAAVCAELVASLGRERPLEACLDCPKVVES